MASVVRATSPRFELLSVVATNHFVLTPSPSLPQCAEEEEGGGGRTKALICFLIFLSSRVPKSESSVAAVVKPLPS